MKNYKVFNCKKNKFLELKHIVNCLIGKIRYFVILKFIVKKKFFEFCCINCLKKN
jgi:hypothetical protein